MKVPIESAITLLHEAPHGTIATVSAQLPGYPYATAVPCVVDHGHRPVFFISALAEHTKNLLEDPRASLSVVKTENGNNIQAAARITLVGDAERIAEPSPELLARYLRFQPDAEEYLALDFMFFCLKPRLARFIAGMGRMGWVESEEWEVPVLSLKDEAALLKQATIEAPRGIRLLGIDCFGIDYEIDGVRARQRFPDAPILPEKLGTILLRVVSKLH